MADPLLTQDIIDGAAVRDRPNLFVIGSFDRRITFYSQQVRALSLVHALKDLGYLNDSPRIAVIGGGAAGVTAAAAAALVSNSGVVLFESANELLSLQSATERRRLDPHIYDWPAHSTIDPIADLPILDWESGSSRSVREDVLAGFENISVRLGQRLQSKTRHRVTKLSTAGDGYEVRFVDLEHQEPDVERTDQFHIVLLAVGFGIEPREPVENIQSASYWSDAGVPVREFEGRPSPRFFVSGAGDGGLIDLVAAGAMNFDHTRMIAMISQHPGINELKSLLINIDVRARAANAAGNRFDFVAIYDIELLAQLTEIGLVAAVAAQLRPGVRLILQTRNPEMFEVSTSILNRLAAYLTIKACEIDHQRTFRHLQSNTVVKVEAPNPLIEPEAAFYLECEGEIIAADSVIVRRGPTRALALGPFEEHLANHSGLHLEWLERHGDAAITPNLSTHARTLFKEAAREAQIPLAPRAQRMMEQLLPLSIQLCCDANRVRWSGEVRADQLVRAWRDSQPFEIILPDGPDLIGPAAVAILRVACHSSQSRLHASPALWRERILSMSVNSQHAEGMSMPKIVGGNPGGAAQEATSVASDVLARQIHHALDNWLLNELDAHLVPFFTSNADPSHAIGLKIAPDLRAAMAVVWAGWHESFGDNAELLNHFLRLMVCARDDEENRDAGQVLVGPTKWKEIVRGTAVALCIAAAWQTTSPKSTGPGNLVRLRDEDSDWTGHGCAANLIDGRDMSLCAASHMWQTQFVILIVKTTIEIALSAERHFAHVETDQPTLSETYGSGPVIMSINRDFSEAVEAGVVSLRDLLAEVETRHFTMLEEAITKEVT